MATLFEFKNKPALFVALAYIFAYPVFIYVSRVGEVAASRSLLEFAMWVPALVVLAFIGLNYASLNEIGFQRIGTVKTLTEAIGIQVALYGLTVLILSKILFVPLVPNGIEIKNSIVSFAASAKMPLALGREPQSLVYFALNFFCTLMMATAFTAIFTMGEEIGWRGYLQKRLTLKFGWAKGTALLGIIWGFWHFPIVAAGYNFPDYPLFGSLVLMQVLTIFTSFWIGYLYVKSRSIYVAALAHAAGNVSDTIAQSFLNLDKRHYLYDLFRFVLLACLAFWSYRRLRHEGESIAGS